jgi:hypothetical protein
MRPTVRIAPTVETINAPSSSRATMADGLA